MNRLYAGIDPHNGSAFHELYAGYRYFADDIFHITPIAG
jgi:hypothetical protein